MWLATFDGLARFDGERFELFKNDPENPGSVSSNAFNTLCPDLQTGDVWMGTYNGLNRYNPDTGDFTSFFNNPEDPASLPNNFIDAIHIDRQGELWVAARSSLLSKFDKETGTFDHFKTLEGSDNVETERTSNRSYCITQDTQNDSILWVGTSAALLRFNKITHKFESTLEPLPGIRNILSHPDGFMYLRGPRGKIIVFDPIAFKVLKELNLPQGWSVRSIFPKGDHDLWVSSGSGLLVINKDSGEVLHQWKNNSSQKIYYDIDYIDEEQRLWSGSVIGLRVFDPSVQQVENFIFSVGQENQSNMVEKMAEDPTDGSIYVNVFSGSGLYRLDPQSKKWSVIPPPDNYDGRSFRGRDLLFNDQGQLLILETYGIYTLSKDKKKMIPYLTSANLEAPSEWLDFMEDHAGNLWIGDTEKGVMRIDLNSGVVSDMDIGVPDCTEARFRFAFFQDSKNNIWISSCNGYSIYIPEEDKFHSFPYQDNQGQEKTFFRIRSFSEDPGWFDLDV